MIHVRTTDVEAKERFRPRAVDLFPAIEENRHTTSLSFWRDGVVVAIFTGVIEWDGVAHLCGMVSEDARSQRVWPLMAAFRTMLLGWVLEHKLVRIAAYVHADEREYHRFARVMGFHEEARLRQAAPGGGDFLLFARLFPCQVYSAEAGRPSPHQNQTMAACGDLIRSG